MDYTKKQIEIESKFSAKAYNKFLEDESDKKTKEGSSIGINSVLKKAIPYYADKKVFDREILNCRALTAETIAYYDELLNYMNREDLIAIVCKTILTAELMEGDADKKLKRKNYKNICDTIFQNLQDEYQWAILKKGVRARTIRAIVVNTSRSKTSKHKRALLKVWVARYLDPNTEKYDITVEIKQLIRPLVDIVLKTKIPIGKDKADCILFEQVTKFTSKTRSVALVNPTDSLLDYVTGFEDKMGEHITKFVPMIIPPIDWTENVKRSGGYLTPICKYDLMHTQEKNCGISQDVLDSVNTIQKTPWRVNKRVHKVMTEIFNKGGREDQDMLVGDVPNKDCILFNKDYTDLARENNAILFKDRHGKSSHYIPKEIHDKWPTKQSFMDADKLDDWRDSPKYIWNKAKQENQWSKNQHESFVISLAEQLRIADEFQEYENIYFPQFLDWRGRIYATPVFLSPQSDSKGKALLEFGEGEAIGHHGVKWLAIHGCNSYGKQEGVSLDKLPMSEREQWVLDNEADIVMSAENPLGFDFWSKAEDPFGFLAFCFEWADFCKSGKSPEFISRIPIGMDATCSGLQHFSALMKDKIGGSEVNLIPNSKPNDIYKTVAEVTRRKHQEFIQDPNKFIQEGDFKCLSKYTTIELKQLARLWKTEDIDRSLCKTPTMTTSYNVTISGITDQIKEMVKKGKKDIGLDANSTDTLVASKIWYACRLIGCIIKESVFEVVKSARDAQELLSGIASKITADNTIIKWTTPMGLEVVQAYKKFSSKRVKLFLSGINISLAVADRGKFSVNNSKSKAGLSPNVIHSLDACHLQMTVNACRKRAGITNFAFIHDQFGTHASKTDLMMRILREEFVSLYSQDVLGNLLNQWRDLCSTVEFEDIPQDVYGDLDVNCVKDSRYFFS